VYRSGVADAPSAVGPAAHEGLADVVSRAGLGHPAPAAVIDTARGAFTDGLNLIGAVSLGLSVVLIGVCVAVLRADGSAVEGDAPTHVPVEELLGAAGQDSR
jgi:hypothetical protein